jgi:hypothetical protein
MKVELAFPLPPTSAAIVFLVHTPNFATIRCAHEVRRRRPRRFSRLQAANSGLLNARGLTQRSIANSETPDSQEWQNWLLPWPPAAPNAENSTGRCIEKRLGAHRLRRFHPRLMTLDLFEVPFDSRYSKLHHCRQNGNLDYHGRHMRKRW